MAEPLLESFDKQPGENFPFAVEFSGRLPAGLSLASGTVAAVVYSTGVTDNSVLNSLSATIVETQAIARVKAGTDGATYKITFTVTLSDGSILEEDVLMNVKDR